MVGAQVALSSMKWRERAEVVEQEGIGIFHNLHLSVFSPF